MGTNKSADWDRETYNNKAMIKYANCNSYHVSYSFFFFFYTWRSVSDFVIQPLARPTTKRVAHPGHALASADLRPGAGRSRSPCSGSFACTTPPHLQLSRVLRATSISGRGVSSTDTSTSALAVGKQQQRCGTDAVHHHSSLACPWPAAKTCTSMQAGAGGAENNGGDAERQSSEADWESWRTRPAAVRGSVEAQHPLQQHSPIRPCVFPAFLSETERPRVPPPSGVVPVLQVSLPASVRSPGVWFVLAGFVKVAALTMTMGTYPFGASRGHCVRAVAAFCKSIGRLAGVCDCPALHCRGAGGPPAHNSCCPW